MKNITEILAASGIQIPEDKVKDFTTDFNANYKTINDWQFQKDEADRLNGQLGTVETKLKAFDGVDIGALKGEIIKLTGDLETEKKNHAAELTKRDRMDETKTFLSKYKFVNDRTYKSIFDDIEKALDDPAYKGKNRQDILDSLTNGEDGKPLEGIFASEQKDANPNPFRVDIPPAGNAPNGGKETGFNFNFTGVRPNSNNT